MNYCEFCRSLPEDTTNPNKQYHDTEYGFNQVDDNILFERFILEINQAGLSWTTILKKRTAFQTAYAQFDISKVANFDTQDVTRLMNDTGIIRNRLKIQAAITNAKQILIIQQQVGSFKNWLDIHHPRSKIDWVKLFKQHFKFVGTEIVGEFLISLGYLDGAHTSDCPIYAKIHHLND